MSRGTILGQLWGPKIGPRPLQVGRPFGGRSRSHGNNLAEPLPIRGVSEDLSQWLGFLLRLPL